MKKLITFQHKEIIEELKKSGVYTCSRTSGFQTATPGAYDHLRTKLNNNIEGDFADPVFAWNQLYNNTPIGMSNDDIARMMDMTEFDLNDYVMIELLVPSEQVLLTNFYDFVDMRYEEEFSSDDDYNIETLKDNVFNVNSDSTEIQAIIKHIKYEWIQSVHSVVAERISHSDYNYFLKPITF